MNVPLLIEDIKPLSIHGNKNTVIQGITGDSRAVKTGFLFIAKKGGSYNGNDFIKQAIEKGASSILTDSFQPDLPDYITQLITPHPAQIEPLLAQRFFSHPSKKMEMVAITGTSGKTTTSYAIYHLLKELGKSPGLIGTVEYIIGREHIEAIRTTPDLLSNYQMLAQMVEQGCQSAVMEVSSHALSQNRVGGIAYDIALFTNLTHEHLDYHKTLEDYFEAKKSLFISPERPAPKVSIINIDCPFGKKLLESQKGISFGLKEDAQLRAFNISFSEKGSSFTVSYQSEKEEFFWPLVGRFNVYNALGAIGVGLSMGASLSTLSSILRSFSPPPGRLEQVPNELSLHIYVDYAHKENALKCVLETLRECSKGSITTVFGCGGNRDREKRPKMAHTAASLSDYVIITSDNPRNEDPFDIAKEVSTGIPEGSPYTIEVDRQKAIALAIDRSKKGDVILIAGKGHEKKQSFHDKVVDFDDCFIAKKYCKTKGPK